MMHRVHYFRPQELTATEIELFEQLTRRRFLIGAGALVLAGCGGPGASAPTATPGATRTITHALGTTEVPAHPRRVLACDYYFTFPTAIKLQVPVVGAPFGAERNLPGWVGDLLGTQDTENIGSNAEPNLEKMAALEPDLIVGFAFFLESIYNQVSTIAPTVALSGEMLRAGWKEGIRTLAEIFGKQEAIEQAMAEYTQRVQDLKVAARTRIEGRTFSLIRVREDEIRVHTNQHFGGAVMEEVGLLRPENQYSNDQPVLRLSLEQLQLADADEIFVVVGGGGQDQAANRVFESLQAHPLWARLTAVNNDAVYLVGEHWLAGELHAANLILDDLHEHLLG